MRAWILFPVACGAIVAGASARADAPTTAAAPAGAAPPALESRRVLDGHVFQPTFLARTPFAATAFDVKLVYGVGEATGLCGPGVSGAGR